jgi:flagellar basal-body rod protein FlgB
MSIDLVAAIAAKALDGLFERQAAIAHNVANAGSDNFSPVRVSFEDALKQAAAPQPGDTPAAVAKRIASVTPRIETPLADAFDGVKLDREITAASETSARYAMLTGMLDRTLQVKMLAIKGA